MFLCSNDWESEIDSHKQRQQHIWLQGSKEKEEQKEKNIGWNYVAQQLHFGH